MLIVVAGDWVGDIGVNDALGVRVQWDGWHYIICIDAMAEFGCGVFVLEGCVHFVS